MRWLPVCIDPRPCIKTCRLLCVGGWVVYGFQSTGALRESICLLLERGQGPQQEHSLRPRMSTTGLESKASIVPIQLRDKWLSLVWTRVELVIIRGEPRGIRALEVICHFWKHASEVAAFRCTACRWWIWKYQHFKVERTSNFTAWSKDMRNAL